MDAQRTRNDLLDELERWRTRAARGTGKARVSLRELSAATGVPRSSLSDYLSGATLMPPDVLDAVVLALGATPAQAGAWADAWERARDEPQPKPDSKPDPKPDGKPAPTLEAGPKPQRGRGTSGPQRDRGTSGPQQLPTDTSAFIGREQELSDLNRMLDAAGVAVVAGTAGVGKTTLAIHWAHTVRHRFEDGQLYVNLRGYDPAEPMSSETALEQVLRGLGVDTVPAAPDARAAMYRTLLADKRMLIVLDNARSAEQVRPLLPGTAGCLAVVTSRDSLAGLVVRDGARRITLKRLADAEALGLLERLIGRDRLHTEPQAAADLVRLCAALPLALRVAAERVGRRSTTALADTVAELEDEAGRLDALGAGGDPLTDIRAVFSWSIRALPEAAARLFRLLGTNPTSDIDAHAAADLAGATLPEARRLLGILTEAHLLDATTHGRFRMHILLRDYARELASAADADASDSSDVGDGDDASRPSLNYCSVQLSLPLPLHV